MAITFKVADIQDRQLLANPADQLFDKGIDPALLTNFLTDPRHHIVIAHDGATVVGIVSALDYVHPDKPRQLWINEVAVANAYRSAGVASQMMRMMLDHARGLGCTEAWVLTDAENNAANNLYRSTAVGAEATSQTQTMYTFDLS